MAAGVTRLVRLGVFTVVLAHGGSHSDAYVLLRSDCVQVHCLSSFRSLKIERIDKDGGCHLDNVILLFFFFLQSSFRTRPKACGAVDSSRCLTTFAIVWKLTMFHHLHHITRHHKSLDRFQAPDLSDFTLLRFTSDLYNNLPEHVLYIANHMCDLRLVCLCD
jgi:hypothetical protein